MDITSADNIYRRESNPALDGLAPYLLHAPLSDRGICPAFLEEVISRFEDDESVKPMLRNAVKDLSLELGSRTMNDNYKPYIEVLTMSRALR